MKQFHHIINDMKSFYKYAGVSPTVHESAFIAPTACLIGNVTVEEYASVWFNTVARGDINAIRIGKGTNIQDGCLMHVTQHLALTVGDRVTVGHGAILHGCFIASGCLSAMGAIVFD